MQRLSRFASLLAGSAVTALLMLFPFMLGPEISGLDRLGLFALLFGVSGSFVHGFGYTPERAAWRVLFSPATAWSLMLAGALCIAL